MKAKEIMIGDWVVKDERTMLVDDVKDGRLTVIVNTLFGNMKQYYDVEEVKPWTIEDVKRGQYLTCVTPDGNNVIFISEGKDDPYQAIAGCNVAQDRVWFNEVCCLGYKECVRPAKRDEMQVLDELLLRQQMRWNLDKKELERIVQPNIACSDKEIIAQQEALLEEMRRNMEEIRALRKKLDGISEWAKFRRQAAAMAMQGLLANPGRRKPTNNYGDTSFLNSKEVAENAVWYADALIDELKKKKGSDE